VQAQKVNWLNDIYWIKNLNDCCKIVENATEDINRIIYTGSYQIYLWR
jgi:hypothetical protein